MILSNSSKTISSKEKLLSKLQLRGIKSAKELKKKKGQVELNKRFHLKRRSPLM